MDIKPDNDTDAVAIIRPIKITDDETGDRISVSVSPYYAKITVNSREYYFIRETGEFDGTATVVDSSPVALVYSADEPS